MQRSTLIAGSFLASHILLVYWSPFPAWGVDLLAYYPSWVQGIFVLLGVVILWPRSRNILLALGAALGTLPGQLLRLVLVLSGLGLFVALRSATALLGDGQLYLSELPLSVEVDSFRVDRAPVIFWLLGQLYRLLLLFDQPPLLAYQLYSYASGLLYLLLVWPAARLFAHRDTERVLIATFLLTPGFLQLFCGYVETYALLLPGILLYAMSGYGVSRRQRPLWTSAGVFGGLVALHLSLINLAPSLGILAFLHWRDDPDGPSTKGLIRTLLSLAATPLAFLVLVLVPGIDLQAYITSVNTDNLLPIWSEPNTQFHNYHLFSSAHLLDFLNLQLLVAPAPLMSLLLLTWSRPSRDQGHLFLLSTALFPLLSAFLINPGIGAFRDWDLLSLSALPCSLWAATALANRIQDKATLQQTSLVLSGAAALHLILWLGLNANATAAQTRFAQTLEQSTVSDLGRAYSWETLGIHHRQQGQHELSLVAYKQAIAAQPNHRYWIGAGDQYTALKRFPEAITAYEQALAGKPDQAAVWTAIGEARFQAGLIDQSLTAWQTALRLEPENLRSNLSLCLAFNKLGRYRLAVAQCQRSLAIDSTAVIGRYELLRAFLYLNEPEPARREYEVLLRLAPDRAHAFAEFFQ